MNLNLLDIIKYTLQQLSQKYVSDWCQKNHLHCTISRPFLCYSLKIPNYGMREKKFFCIYGYFRVSNIPKDVEKRVDAIAFLDSYVCINNPCWQVMFYLLLTVILSEIHENPRKKIELQKKVHRKIFVRDITFLAARPPYAIFCRFFRLLPLFRLLRFSAEKKKIGKKFKFEKKFKFFIWTMHTKFKLL